MRKTLWFFLAVYLTIVLFGGGDKNVSRHLVAWVIIFVLMIDDLFGRLNKHEKKLNVLKEHCDALQVAVIHLYTIVAPKNVTDAKKIMDDLIEKMKADIKHGRMGKAIKDKDKNGKVTDINKGKKK